MMIFVLGFMLLVPLATQSIAQIDQSLTQILNDRQRDVFDPMQGRNSDRFLLKFQN